MIRVNVRPDFRALELIFGDLVRKQVPFASALALTRIGERGRDAGRGRMRGAFDLRNRNLPKSIIRTPARKSDWPHQKTIVGPTNRTDGRLGFLTDQEFGGVKRPIKSKNLAVPASKAVARLRTKTGKIKLKARPSSLLKSETKPRAFIAAGKIWRREGPDRLPIEHLYSFVRGSKGAKIPKRFGMVGAVRRSVERNYAQEFQRAMAQAVRTAR